MYEIRLLESEENDCPIIYSGVNYCQALELLALFKTNDVFRIEIIRI